MKTKQNKQYTKNSPRSSTNKLLKRRIREVSWLEQLRLKHAGRRDGKAGLPREQEDGEWTSPWLREEVRAYNETAASIWTQLQLEAENDFAALKLLLDEADEQKALLASAEAALDEERTREMAAPIFRKPGEEALNEALVAARRNAERAKRLMPAADRVRQLQTEFAAKRFAALQLAGVLRERDNSARMISHKLNAHLFRRVLLYWDAALRKHPAGEKMPAFPQIEVTDHSELAYNQLHQLLLDRAEKLRCDEKED